MFNYFKKQHNLFPPEKHFRYVFFIEHKDTLAEIVEICLQKSIPWSGKLTITNYLKQHDFGFQTHVTVENNLKVKKCSHSI